MAGDRNVVIRLRGDIGDFQAKMVAAGKSVGSVADKVTGAEKESVKLRDGLTSVGDAAGKMGAVAAAGVGLVTKAAVDWETAWAGVTKTVDGTPAQMAALEDSLRDLARTLPATHTEIAAVAEAAGQLGVERDSVAAFTETMIALGETTNLTADEAATSIARFANIMGTSADEVERIGSAMVDLGNNSATTEAEILALGTRLAAAGEIAGLSEADVLAFAATLTSVGVEAEAGGTALSKVFTSVRDAALTGGSDLETFAEVAGVSAAEFRAAFEQDAAGAIELFIAGLGRINESGESTTAVFNSLELTDQRLMRALLSTATAGDLLADSLALGNRAWEENTALAAEAAKRYDTTASQVQVAWNNIKDAAIEFGAVALPVVSVVADGVGGLAQSLGSLPGPVKQTATALGGITAVLGGGLWFTSKVINGVARMRDTLDNLRVTAGQAKGVLGGLGVTAAGIASLYAVGKAMEAVEDSMLDALPGVEEMTAALLNLRDAEVARQFAEDLGDVGVAIDRVTDAGMRARGFDFMHSAGNQMSFLATSAEELASKVSGYESFAEAEQDIKALDEALANIVTSGSPEAAERVLDDLAAAQGLSADQMKRLRDNLPAFDEALAGAANSAQLAAAGSGAAADGFGDLADAAEDAYEEVDAVTAALESLERKLDQRGERREAEQAMDDLRDRFKERRELVKELAEAEQELANAETAEERDRARDRIADVKEQLADYKLTLDDTTQSGRDWNEALEDIALNTLEAAEQMEGMARVEFLNRKRREFIELAERITGSKKAAKELADELGLVHQKKVRPEIDVDTSDALVKIEGFLNAIPRRIAVDIVRGQRSDWSGATPGFADGGFTGYGGKYEPAGIVHRGEFVFDAQTTAMFRPFFEELHRTRRLPGYSGGGFVRQVAAQTSGYTGPSTVGLSDGDIQRLALAMSQARPLYGDVHVSGDGSFRREMELDRQRAALEGRRPTW